MPQAASGHCRSHPVPSTLLELEEVVWVRQVEAKKLMQGFLPSQLGAAHSPACSQLSDLPQEITYHHGRQAGLLHLNPSVPEAGMPERKTRVPPGMRMWRLRLCSHLSRGSMSPSQMNELINDNPMVKSVELSRW